MAIKVTAAAAEKIKDLIKEKQLEDAGLKIGIKGGSCAGFEYVIDLIKESEKFDIITEEFGIKIFCDKKSYLFLNGTIIDYQKSLMAQGFVFNNPNSKGSCGCGKSFNI